LLRSVILAFVVALAPLQALAAPPANADQSLAPWFGSLQTANGTSCCGAADCRSPKEYPIKITSKGYEVYVLGKWLAVPKEAISDRLDNPTGDYVICVQEDHWLEGERQPQVLCLFKASQF